MKTKKLSGFEVITNIIGEFTVLSADIEQNINNVICRYFITSEKKKEQFMKWLLWIEGYSFEEKIECLKIISDSINDEKLQGIISLTVMYARRFNLIKNRLAYGEILIDKEAGSVIVKTVSDSYKYEYKEITPEYIGIMRDTAVSTIEGLKNAINLIIGTEQVN